MNTQVAVCSPAPLEPRPPGDIFTRYTLALHCGSNKTLLEKVMGPAVNSCHTSQNTHVSLTVNPFNVNVYANVCTLK